MQIFTSSYDGRLRLMDVGEERFDIMHSFDDAIFSFSQLHHDPQTLLLGEGQGGFTIWDLRAGKISFSALLHSRRINSIDCSPSNTNLIATSSTDGLACIWDLRTTHTRKPNRLKVVEHKKAVHSAFFSPSGNYLATTRYLDKTSKHFPLVVTWNTDNEFPLNCDAVLTTMWD